MLQGNLVSCIEHFKDLRTDHTIQAPIIKLDAKNELYEKLEYKVR